MIHGRGRDDGAGGQDEKVLRVHEDEKVGRRM
jgi:hypothetical protein